MLQLLQFENRTGRVVSLAVLLLSVALFAGTGEYLFAALPFAYLFLLLAIVNWKAAYWVFLFTIPASIQIWFFNYTLSTSVPDEPIMWLFLLVFPLKPN